MPDELKLLLEELLQIRFDVLQLQIKGRISANSAFLIFLLLTQSAIQYLGSKVELRDSYEMITIYNYLLAKLAGYFWVSKINNYI